MLSLKNEIAMMRASVQERVLNLWAGAVFTALLILIVSAMPTQSVAKDAVSIDWEGSYEAALEKALGENKPVVVYLYVDGCDSCETMDAETLSNPEVVKFSRGQLYVRLNVAEGTKGSEVAKQFGTTIYPTILIVDGHGIEIGRLEGSGTPEDFVSLMCSFLAEGPFKPEPPQCTLSTARDVRKFFAYGKQKYDLQEFEQARKVFQRIVEIDPKNTYGTTDRALLLLGVCTIYLGHPEKGGTVLSRLIREFPNSLAIPDASFILGQVYLDEGRTDEAKHLFRTLVEKYPRHIFASEARKALDMLAPHPPK
jgi:tetratricopeptide (TPR) repeat protein